MGRQHVLSVGQCGYDDSVLSNVLTDHFDVDVDRIMHVEDAVEALSRKDYDLVLVNRLIFDDGSPGMDLIRRMRSGGAAGKPPVMLISNYPEAQAEAVKAGAEPGFGKSAVGSPETVNRLSRHLRRRCAASSADRTG